MWLLRLPTNAFLALFYFDYYFVLLLVTAIGVAMIWRFKPRGWTFTLREVFAGTALLSVVLSALVVAGDHRPLRICFRQSEVEMDRIADELLASTSAGRIDVDKTAGYYHVTSGRVVDGAAILRLDRSDWSHEFYGFIRIPDHHGEIDGEKYGLPDSGFKHVGGDWFVFYSLYWSVKIGWS